MQIDPSLLRQAAGFKPLSLDTTPFADAVYDLKVTVTDSTGAAVAALGLAPAARAEAGSPTGQVESGFHSPVQG